MIDQCEVRASKLGRGGIIGRWLVGYCMLGCKTWEKGCGWLVCILYVGGGKTLRGCGWSC